MNRELHAKHLLLSDHCQVLVRCFPHRDVLDLGTIAAIAHRFLRLTPQRTHALGELGDDIGHAQQVLPGLIELALGSLLLGLELGDSGGLFDDRATVLGARRNDLANPTLLDDRVSLGANAGSEEEIGDIAQPAWRAVDEIR